MALPTEELSANTTGTTLAPATPDYLTSPNAVFGDKNVQWRYGKAPDYSKTRRVWEEGRKMNHAAGSLEQVVENLVKNWEVEASFKPRLQDWRTIDPENYTFAMSGGPPQTAEHMLKVGTYNAIIEPNEYYDPTYSDFASSHKTFKRMMPTFAWEVMEVYSGPPKVAFRWRHWGEMKNDYVGFNNKGQKVTAKAHGGPIEIFGTTVATVDDKVRLKSVDTYMDSLSMFRQIAPHGVVNTQPMDHKVDKASALDSDLDNDGIKIAEQHNLAPHGPDEDQQPGASIPKHFYSTTGQLADAQQQAGGCPFVMKHGISAGDKIPKGHPEVRNRQTSTGPTTMTETGSVGGVSAEASSSIVGANLTQLQFDGGATHGTVRDVDQPPSQSSHPYKHEDVLTTQQSTAMAIDQATPKRASEDDIPRSIYSSAVSGHMEDIIKVARKSEDYVDEQTPTGTRDAVDDHLESSTDVVHPHSKSMEPAVQPEAGEAVVVAADSKEAWETAKEMSGLSDITVNETDLIMNRE